MKVVVSGASGFLGGQLIERLASDGVDRVVGLVFEPQILAALTEAHRDNDRFQFVGSSDAEGSCQALAGADVLVHCAFPRASGAALLAAGMDYGCELFTMAREAGCAAVINISSQSVYDSLRQQSATETSPLVLDTPYATAKYASELMLGSIYAELPHTSIRLASLIGPGFDQRVPNKMAKRALGGGQIEVMGGEQLFDYMDGRDAADALSAIARSDASTWAPVYNLSAMQPTSLSMMAAMVTEAVRKRGTVLDDPLIKKSSEGPSNPNSSVDARPFMKAFGWRPCVGLSESIDAIVDACLAKQEALGM